MSCIFAPCLSLQYGFLIEVTFGPQPAGQCTSDTQAVVGSPGLSGEPFRKRWTEVVAGPETSSHGAAAPVGRQGDDWWSGASRLLGIDIARQVEHFRAWAGNQMIDGMSSRGTRWMEDAAGLGTLHSTRTLTLR